MKTLYFISGPIAVNKEKIACQILTKLPACIYLASESLEVANPPILNDETNKLHLDNLSYVLNNYLKSQSYQNIIFTINLKDKEQLNNILNKLDLKQTKLCHVTLYNSKNAPLTESYNDINSTKIDVKKLKLDDLIKEIVVLDE